LRGGEIPNSLAMKLSARSPRPSRGGDGGGVCNFIKAVPVTSSEWGL